MTLAVVPSNAAPASNKLIDELGERLVKIKRNGLYIDPLSIVAIHARAIARSHKDLTSGGANQPIGNVTVETRAKQIHVITCGSLKEANQLADTLAYLTNSRARDSARIRVERSVDWGKERLAGDPKWEEAKAERERIFSAFD
jgi:hypothetical protein